VGGTLKIGSVGLGNIQTGFFTGTSFHYSSVDLKTGFWFPGSYFNPVLLGS